LEAISIVKPGVADLDESHSDTSEQELENKTTEPPRYCNSARFCSTYIRTGFVMYISQIITLNPNSAIIARDEAAEIIDRVLKSLKDLGITEDDIETTSYEIEAKYEWKNNIRVFKGFEVIVTMKVTLKDFDKAGQVIDASLMLVHLLIV